MHDPIRGRPPRVRTLPAAAVPPATAGDAPHRSAGRTPATFGGVGAQSPIVVERASTPV